MDRSVMMAYTEVDRILNLMDEQYQKKIPEKLRKLISESKLNDYDVIINPQIPLKEQKISRKALSILAVLNYNYWCVGESKKQKLIEKYIKNEKIKQEKLRELYNPDNLFNNKNEFSKQNIENKQLIVYNKKENVIIKIFNKIKKLLKIDITQKK